MTTLEDYETEVHESKGILDPEQEYTFELKELKLQENVIFIPDKDKESVSKEIKEAVTGKTKEEIKDEKDDQDRLLTTLVQNDWYQDRINMEWVIVDEEAKAVIYENWRIDKLTLNNNNPEYETRMVTFAKKTGHVVEEGTKLKPNDLVKTGMQIKAHPELKADNKNHRLNINTIKFACVAPQTHQKPMFADVSKEMQGKVLAQIEGAKTKEEAMQMLLTNKKSSLVGAMLAMVESGDVKFGEEKQ